MCIIYHWMMTSQYLHGEQVDELNKDDMLTCHMDCVFNVSCPDEGCVCGYCPGRDVGITFVLGMFTHTPFEGNGT